MNDYEYTFKEDVREKKAAGRGAFAKRGGSKSKKCSLPSDNLTPAQQRALNGAVNEYNLSLPMSYENWKVMPKDLQEEYIRRVCVMFGVTVSAVNSELFNLNRNVLAMYAKKRGIKLPTRKGARDNEYSLHRLKAWANGEVEQTIAEENICVEENAAEETVTRFPLKTATLQMEGSANDIVQALQLFLCGRSAELEISIKFTEE